MPPSTRHAPVPHLRTWEMVEWLREKLEVPEELGEAVLGVWVWALRYAALSRAEQDESFQNQLRNGKAELPLSVGLAPPGWRDEDLRKQLTLQTGLPDEDGRRLLEKVAAKLREIDGRYFEPVGQIFPNLGVESGFTLHFRPDFLEPALEEPADLGEELISEVSLNRKLEETLAALRDVREHLEGVKPEKQSVKLEEQ